MTYIRQDSPQGSNKNILVVPTSGYYVSPFPFGRNYTSVTFGLQASFWSAVETTGPLSSGIITADTCSYGAGPGSGFYLSLISSNDYGTTYLPFQVGVPSMGIAAVKNVTVLQGQQTGGVITNVVSVAPYRAAGITPQLANFENFQCYIPRDNATNSVDTYLKADFYDIGQIGQRFVFNYVQKNTEYPGEVEPNHIQYLLNYTYLNPVVSTITGYWTDDSTALGNPLSLPNGFAAFNGFTGNDLVIYNAVAIAQ